jgi:hypothetical protein
MRLRSVIPFIGAIIVGCADQSAVTTPKNLTGPKASFNWGDNSLTGPTSINDAGTYAYQMCFTADPYLAQRFKIAKSGTSGYVYDNTVAGNSTGNTCMTLNLPVNAQSSFTLTGYAYMADGLFEGQTSTLSVTVNILSIGISGSYAVPSDVLSTYNAQFIFAGVAPYTYAWSGVLYGTSSSVSGYIPYPGMLYLTVTDARGKQSSASAYICVDNVC